MDPEKNASENSSQDMNNATLSDLHNEGVDVMNESRMAEENEFSEETSVAPQISPQTEQPLLTPPVVEPAQPTAPPAPPENKPSGKNDPSIKALRTYKTDAEEAVRYQNISAAKIALAEQQRREARTPIQYEDTKKSTSGVFILSILFILIAGAGGSYYFFFMNQKAPTSTIPRELNVQMIMGYSKADLVEISSETDPLSSIATKLTASPVQTGGVYALVPVPTGTTTLMSSTQSLFRETSIPPILERSLGTQYMIGSYMLETNNPFFILKNTFFQNTFAGMLMWEKDIKNDLLPIIKVSHPEETAGSVRTDTFEDLVVSNIDVRILKNADGKIILAYAFTDKNTLVITTGTQTLSAIIQNLLAVRVVQ